MTQTFQLLNMHKIYMYINSTLLFLGSCPLHITTQYMQRYMQYQILMSEEN